MKNDLTTGAWQHDIRCPISIVLLSTSDVNAAVGSIAIVLMGFLGLLHAPWIANGILSNILPEQEDASLQFTRVKGLCINDLSVS